MKNNKQLIALLALIVITLAVYWPSTGNGYVWDDDDYIVNNPTLSMEGGLQWIWYPFDKQPVIHPVSVQYYPMTYSSFWLEYQLFELDFFWYHLNNILLHIGVVLLLWRCLLLLKIPGAWAIAALFALHPVNVETVAWMTERKNVLSGFFYLLSALSFFKYYFDDNEVKRNKKYYIFSLVLFVCALLSKSVTCTLPMVLLLLLWWKKSDFKVKDSFVLLPFFGIGLASAFWTIWIEQNIAGAKGGDWDIGFLESCLIAGRALCFYVSKLLWPTQLSFNYPHWSVDSSDLSQYLYPVAVLTVFVVLWGGRKKWGKGALVALLCFAATLFPALGFFNVFPFYFSYVADHFQYLASFFVITLVVQVFCCLAQFIKEDKRQQLASVVLVALLALFAMITRQEQHQYKDAITLWQETIQRNPHSFLALNHLAAHHAEQGELDKALKLVNDSLLAKADYPLALKNKASIYEKKGQFTEAEHYYLEAIKIKPDYLKALNNLGVLLKKQKKYEAAETYLKRAYDAHPMDYRVNKNLADVYRSQNRIEEAIKHYKIAVKFEPLYALAHFELFNIYKITGHKEEAKKHSILMQRSIKAREKKK